MSKIKLGKYQHYKGKEYEVIGLGRHSENLEELVIYQGFYNSKKFGNNPIWVRPKNMFFENVIVNNKKMPRFKYLG